MALPAAPDTRLNCRVNESGTDWLLWQLADSAFPTGGFAHSAGLEAAWQHGEVHNRGELFSFVEASLHQLGQAALPFLTAAHEQPERLEEFDHICDSFTTNHIANRASRLQGRAFLTAAERTFRSSEPSLQASSPSKGEGTLKRPEVHSPASPPFTHFAPVFGAITRKLGIPREMAVRLFLFSHLRGLFAAAVRLNIVGPMEAQTLQHRLSVRAEEIVLGRAHLSLDDLAQTAPLLDLWQGTHDRLYSRLFQS